MDIKSPSATWTGNLATHVGYNDANVRQGAPLTVTRMTPSQTGKLKVTWTVSGSVKPLGFSTVNLGSKTFTDDAACSRRLLGSLTRARRPRRASRSSRPRACPPARTSSSTLQAKFKVTPEGAIVSRSFSVGGSPAAPARA